LIAALQLFVIYYDIIWAGRMSMGIPAAVNQANLFALSFAFLVVKQ
jgi:hypothetical protein